MFDMVIITGTLPDFKLLCLIVIGCAQCCSNICYSAYKMENNIIPLLPTRVPVTLRPTGVVTVRAAYIPDTTWSWEYIRFMKIESRAEPIVIQVYHGKPGLLGKVSMYAEDDKGPYSYTRYSETGVFADLEEDIFIQVSYIHVDEDNAYRVYLGKPGEASFIRYNYNNNRSAAWNELSYMRFNTTRQIKTDNNAVYFKSVTVCSDDVPLLCDGEDVVIPAVEGSWVNLTCSGSGAPYLESVWITNDNETLGTFTELPIEEVSIAAADQLVNSTVVIQSFKATHHVGIWRCFISNKNLATASRTKTFYVTAIIQEPISTHYNITKKNVMYKHQNEIEIETLLIPDEGLQLPSNLTKHQVFKWVIKGWPSTQSQNQSDILLECQQIIQAEPYQIAPEYIMYKYNSTNFQHSATLTLLKDNTDITGDFINCSLNLALKRGDTTQKIGALINTTLYRIGYWCEEGEYGVGDKCLACPVNKMSYPRSVECFTIRNERDIMTVILPPLVIVSLLILIYIAAVTAHIAIKYKWCSKKSKDTPELPLASTSLVHPDGAAADSLL